MTDDDRSILRARAKALAIANDETSASERIEILVFRLNKQLFAIRSQHTVEIFRFQPSTLVPLPGCQDQVSGVISLRGSLLPIVQTRLLLLTSQEAGDERNVVVVKTNESDYGLLVDEVLGMRLLPIDELLVPSGGDAAPWVRGVTLDDVTVLHLLPLLTFQNLGFPEDPRVKAG